MEGFIGYFGAFLLGAITSAFVFWWADLHGYNCTCVDCDLTRKEEEDSI